jgi:Transcriptional regulators
MNEVTELFLSYLDLSRDKSLHEIVYDAFYRMIITGKIPAGTRINEKQISTYSNISRTPIRQALKDLEKEKLVAYGLENKHGAVVLGITHSDVLEIFAIRRAFETIATIEASKKMTPEDFDELKKIVDRGEELFKEEDLDAIRDNFKEFNSFIFDKSSMFRIQNIIETLKVYQLYFHEITTISDVRTRQALDEHRLIYELMKNKDEDGISALIDKHLKASSNFISSVIEEDGGDE